MSIRQIKSKKAKSGYTYQVYFPYTNQYGVKSKHYKGGFTTKKQAQEYEIIVKNELIEYGYLKKECKLTLNEVSEEYFKIGCNNLRENTIINYKGYYKNGFKKSIGLLPITSLHYKNLQEHFNTFNNYTKPTLTLIKAMLKNIFDFALKNEYIENNPVNLISLPKAKQPKDKKKTITKQDLDIIIQELKNKNRFLCDSLVIAIYISYYTGMRKGEVLALNKDDIDFYKNTISVNKNLIYNTKPIKVVNVLKTESSKGIIPLAPQLKEILKEWFNINPYDLICCQENGDLINGNITYTYFKQFTKKYNIDFHFHMLRHTFTSNLISNGVPVEIVKELDRHSDIKTTLNTYTHIKYEDKEKALFNYFNSENEKESVKKVLKINTNTIS